MTQFFCLYFFNNISPKSVCGHTMRMSLSIELHGVTELRRCSVDHPLLGGKSFLITYRAIQVFIFDILRTITLQYVWEYYITDLSKVGIFLLKKPVIKVFSLYIKYFRKSRLIVYSINYHEVFLLADSFL